MEKLIYRGKRYGSSSPLDEMRDSLPIREGEKLEILFQKEEDGWVEVHYIIYAPLSATEITRRIHEI